MALGFLPLPLLPITSGDVARLPAAADLVLSGSAPTVAATDNHARSPAAAQLVLSSTEFQVETQPQGVLVPAPKQLALSSFAPSLDVGASPAAGQLTLSAGNVSLDLNLTPPAAQLSMVGTAPLATVNFVIVTLAASHIFLVEIDGHDGSEVVTKDFSTDGFTSLGAVAGSDVILDENDEPILDENDDQIKDETAAGRNYDPRIIDLGSFQRRLGLLETSSTSSGDVVVASGDPGHGETLDDLLTFGFGNRDIAIFAQPRGERSVTDFALTMFRGKVRTVKSARPLEQIEFEIADRLADLDFPLLTERYNGSTTSSAATAEGNADLQGQIKQRVYGQAFNVLVQPANPYDLIYLVSNSPLSAVTLYDGGLTLINDGNHPTLVGLRAASISGGHYATCLALGLVRVGGTPEFNLTADVIEGSGPNQRTAAQIAFRMMTDFGISAGDIDAASFDGLDDDNMAVTYAVIDDDRTALEAVQQVLQSIGGWLLPNHEGEFQVGRFEAPVPANPELQIDVEIKSLQDALVLVRSDVPVWRVVVKYQRVHHVQEDESLAGAVTSERRAFLSSEFRTVTAQNSAIKTKHLNAREITLTTQIVESDAAQTEADRLLDLLSPERSVYEIALSLQDGFRALPGQSITLTHPRLGMVSGKNFLVISREDRFAEEQITLQVWG